MKAIYFSLLDIHLKQLQKLLVQNDGCEHAAYVLFGNAQFQIGDGDSDNIKLLVSHAIEEVASESIISSTPWEITWSTTDVIKKFKKAQTKNLTLGIVHNHTSAYPHFSEVDDQNEAELVKTLQNRSGSSSQLASLLLTPDGRWRARLWLSDKKCLDAAELRTIGDKFVIDRQEGASDSAVFLERQKLAFGAAFNSQVQNLTISIVGCGGTGSAVAMLLARLGVGTIALIDNDTVEETNLNRLHGATFADAKNGTAKIEVVARSISELGLGTRLIRHKGWISDESCRNVLKSSHLVFGCTDDNAGRILLNRFAYAYQIPVIDMGLAIQLTLGDKPTVQVMDGRVTVLIPGDACLLCREVIQPRLASEETLKRQNPKEYEKRKAEAYVIGEHNPNPAVITFTTELACMAVNEMIQRLQGFRGPEGSTPNRVRLFHRMLDLRPSRKPDPDCRVCGQPEHWCRGDVEPFLGIVG